MRALWPSIVLLLSCAEPMVDSPLPMPGPSSSTCLAFNPIDFGEVELGSREDRQFPITNFTVRPVFVTVGRVNAPFQVSASGEFQLEPGETLSLRVSYLPNDGRLHLGTLAFTGGRECEPQQVSLRGLGAGILSVEPADLQFGLVPFDVVTRRTLTVRNSRRQPLDVTLMKGPTVFSAPTALRLEALSEVQIEVGVEPIGGGFVGDDITFRSQLGDRAQVTLSAIAGAPKLELEPASIEVPVLPLAPPAVSPLTRKVTLHNRGTAGLEVNAFIASGPAGELQVTTPMISIAPGSSVPTTLRFTPSMAVGPREWSVWFTTNEPEAPMHALRVAATVVAVPACERVTATSSVPSPAPSVITVTLLNEGNSECLVDDLRLFDPLHWSIDAPQQVVLAGHGSFAVRVQAPTSGLNALMFNAVGSPDQPMGFTMFSLEAR